MFQADGPRLKIDHPLLELINVGGSRRYAITGRADLATQVVLV
jgi:hypothetical protein